MADKEMCYGHGKGHVLIILGILAIVWGILNYLTSIGWTSYGAWIAAGVILVVVGWAKKSYLGKK